MILWTVQELDVWELIQETGIYRCDPSKCAMPEFAEQYEWMVKKMSERIGSPPEGVTYPVWAWYQKDGKRRKPDLRSVRWGCEQGEYACIEVNIPDEQVVLSDFDAWHGPLNDCLLADTDEEYVIQEAYYNSLTDAQKKAYRDWNWEQIFDVSLRESDWLEAGNWIQATFWELKKEQICGVRFFKGGKS